MTTSVNHNEELIEEWKRKREDPDFIHTEQKKISGKILRNFIQKKKVIITLCTPPQWGKTGVSIYVAYHMCLQGGVKMENVFFITGMSDTSWVDQTKERVLPCWKDQVYHRNQLWRMTTEIESLKESDEDRDILIIIDECHIANKKDHQMSSLLNEIGITDLEFIKNRNIKILQISATPSNALIDAESWGKEHKKISVGIDTNYVSFRTFKEQKRLYPSMNLIEKDNCLKLFEMMNSFNEPRYHFIRSVCKGPTGKLLYRQIKQNILKICENQNYDLIEMNGMKTREKIHEIYHSLSIQPEKNTIILIKDMLGASKTIDDSYIGCVHESTPNEKGYSSEVQGLPGRLCGWSKRKGQGSPIIFCEEMIIDQYIKLCESGFNLHEKGFEWKDGRLKINQKGKIRSKESYLIQNESS
jgi:hypothetical protein